MSFARGFKSKAETLAEELRKEAGLPNDRPADLHRLAEVVGAEIISASSLVSEAALEQLKEIQGDAFSACTFNISGRQVIVFNPLNSDARRASDVAHELAHVILRHDVRRLQRIGNFPFVSCDHDQEDEAQWLAAALLLPRTLLIQCARHNMSPADIAEQFHVSERIASYRLHATGIYLQMGRERRRASV